MFSNYLLNFYHNPDFENWFLSCGSSPWKSCHWCGWNTHLLWLWYDGRDQIFYSWEVAWTFLCSLWERRKKGLFSILGYCFLGVFLTLACSVELQKPKFNAKLVNHVSFTQYDITTYKNVYVNNMLWLSFFFQPLWSYLILQLLAVCLHHYMKKFLGFAHKFIRHCDERELRVGIYLGWAIACQ